WKKLEAGDATGESAALRGKIVAVVDAFRELGQVLGLEWGSLPTLSQEEVKLLNEREAARKRKDFAAADKIRQELAKRGVVVEDTAHGPIAIPKR
ncbi:MAG: hypothetical protein Q8R78_02245, partial [Candidatus Omnitrophota bacterium]|nr:hypothetical protein [Candidatus Omnitrophota bacterium]